jgi:hypothetical protein
MTRLGLNQASARHRRAALAPGRRCAHLENILARHRRTSNLGTLRGGRDRVEATPRNAMHTEWGACASDPPPVTGHAVRSGR